MEEGEETNVYYVVLCLWLPVNCSISRAAVDEDHEIMRIMPIGAGNEVGRSCIILKYMGKTIMLDCGIHPVCARFVCVFVFVLSSLITPASSIAHDIAWEPTFLY